MAARMGPNGNGVDVEPGDCQMETSDSESTGSNDSASDETLQGKEASFSLLPEKSILEVKNSNDAQINGSLLNQPQASKCFSGTPNEKRDYHRDVDESVFGKNNTQSHIETKLTDDEPNASDGEACPSVKKKSEPIPENRAKAATQCETNSLVEKKYACGAQSESKFRDENSVSVNETESPKHTPAVDETMLNSSVRVLNADETSDLSDASTFTSIHESKEFHESDPSQINGEQLNEGLRTKTKFRKDSFDVHKKSPTSEDNWVTKTETETDQPAFLRSNRDRIETKSNLHCEREQLSESHEQESIPRPSNNFPDLQASAEAKIDVNSEKQNYLAPAKRRFSYDHSENCSPSRKHGKSSPDKSCSKSRSDECINLSVAHGETVFANDDVTLCKQNSFPGTIEFWQSWNNACINLEKLELKELSPKRKLEKKATDEASPIISDGIFQNTTNFESSDPIPEILSKLGIINEVRRVTETKINDDWNWTFKVKLDNFGKFKKQGKFYVGTGVYYMHKNNRPPSLEFFPATINEVDSDANMLSCNVCVPHNVSHSNRFFFTCCCLCRTADVEQQFCDLIALSDCCLDKKIMVGSSAKVEDWGPIMFKESKNKKKPAEKPPTKNKKSNVKIDQPVMTDEDRSKGSVEDRENCEGHSTSKPCSDDPQTDNADKENLESSSGADNESITYGLRDIVGNKEAPCKSIPSGEVITLNALFGLDLLSLKLRKLVVCVVAFVDNSEKLIPGRVVGSTENFVWIDFNVVLSYRHRLEYKYCVVENLTRPEEHRWEFMHKNGYVNRLARSADFPSGQKKIKYDGLIKFIGKKETKKGFFGSLKSAVSKSFTGKKDHGYYQSENLEAFEYYCAEIAKVFTKTLDLEWVQEQWRSVIRTLTYVRWCEGYDTNYELVQDGEFLENASKSFLFVYSTFYEPSVEARESFEANIFKLSVILFLGHYRKGVEKLDSDQWDSILKLLKFKDEGSEKAFSSQLSSLQEGSSFFECIRGHCQQLLRVGIDNKLKSSKYFYILIEWALLDEKRIFLKLPPQLLLKNDVVDVLKASYLNNATNRHLLLLSILSDSWKVFTRRQKWLSSDILYCLVEVWRSREELPEAFIDLLDTFPPTEESESSEIEMVLKAFLFIMNLLIKNCRSCHFDKYKFFINNLLSLSLDALAVSEKKFGELNPEMFSDFYQTFQKLLRDVMWNDKFTFEDLELFYWANVLRIRDGYSHKSVEFIEGNIKTLFLSLLNESFIRRKIPSFCLNLSTIMDGLKHKGFKIHCHKNLEAALEKALIATIFSGASPATIDVDFLLCVDNRPLVAEAFGKAVYGNFPNILDLECEFDVVLKILEYQHISTVLDLVKNKNKVFQFYFTKQITVIKDAFVKVLCRLDSSDLKAKEFQLLWSHHRKFGELCDKLSVLNQNAVEISFIRLDKTYHRIEMQIQEIAKLLELTNKFESSEIRIDTSAFKHLNKEWENYPLNELAEFKAETNEFVFVIETPCNEDMNAVKEVSELMESRIFGYIATKTITLDFQRSEQLAFHYKHLLHVELKKAQSLYLEHSDLVAQGRLSVNQARQLFKPCPNESSKIKEIELFFQFLKKEAPNESSRLENVVQIRQKQLKEMDSLGTSVSFMNSLKRLVEMLEIPDLEANFAQLAALEDLDSLQVRDLTDDLLSCNNEFSHITGEQILAIDSFVEQPAFLDWIKNKMKSLQDLTVVAELASMSAGEVAYDIDRVKFFHDAIFGYAPFIYDLSKESDFCAVKVACDEVFSKLKTDKMLPEKYADSARHQLWFEKALETQGSVEKSSLEKALLINRSGEYSIAYKPLSNKTKVLISIEDVIYLQYKEKIGSDGENEEETRIMSLLELRDLLSRLMLIVGREKHDQTQSVDAFIATFQNIERLATAYVILFNSGCSFFQNWKAIVRNRPSRNEPSLEIHFGGKNLMPLHGFCAKTNADLSDLCGVLEAIKLKWQEYVLKMRNKHPVLNQFNVQQLKVISSSLAKSKRTQEPVEERAVYYMRSLNRELSALDIQNYLEESIEEDEMEIADNDEEIDENKEFDVSNLARITEEACVDKRSQLLSLIDKLKDEFNDNETLAKAAIQATGASDYDDAVNWILDNEDQDEIIQYFAEKFDDEFKSLELEECQTDISTVDDQDGRSPRREFSFKLEKLFDGYLLNLRENALPDFMNLHQVGKILSQCTKAQTVEDGESLLQMPPHLKPGRPHLIVCEKRKDLLPHIVSLYRFASRQQLPDYSQVLFCNSRTTIQELEVFLLRATLDPESRVYSMAFADDLNANCADHLEKYLFETNVKNTSEFKLVVFCCDESSQVSVILEKHKTKLGCEYDDVLRSYISENLETKSNAIDEYRARLVTSTQPSSGKSLHIDRLEEQMEYTNHRNRVVLRLYDRKINFEKVLDILWDCRKMENPVILHFDVSSNVLENVDELIFKLCILGGITDERGQLFVTRENFFVAFEMLEPREKSVWGRLCKLLPTTHCLSPNQCLSNQNELKEIGNQRITADARIISSDEFQRPNQYLTRVDANHDVTNYRYENHHRAEEIVVIQTLKNWSGLRNPTWAQLSNFAKFLNEQLESCENNVFVNYGDFPGFKQFLIRHCLVKMAQDFALPSLSISDNSPLFGLEEHQTNYAVHQIRRRWESHPHPYVFFNADMSTFTFLGVRVHNTHLLDSNGNVLAPNVMAADLEQQIKRQAYDEPHILGENFDQLPKDQKFTKLCRVLGVENEMRGRNVDSNYELTQDNVMKLLAIHMRFRCGIPVIIMGETGCGKTRLIEYLCLLIGRGRNVQNKKIVKVHGGVTVDDIVRSIEEAEALAQENNRKFGRDFYTVLFFDEANTTEAIYAIKEVVCDFSVNGRKLDPNSGLKVIVACNPYRKHDDKMIKKLESQGLGYHVKSSETEDKLDSDIPMRHLVYRVNPLPPSLLPLVWDFGQLTSRVEDKYIKQIVARYANKFDLNEKDTHFVCEILSISQKFLRENRDQCLFVSLRDIERAMTVLGFFYSKREILFSEMDGIEENNMVDDDDEADEAINELARLMILTLGVCYHSSLEDRDQYRNAIARAFKCDYKLPNGAKSISKELELCQQVFVQNLHLDEKANIAKNLALSENVFMMIICIQLRIPLFLVGKPGSSKSLAKTIVIDAMQGGSSRNEFFKLLKQVQMLSFQCSPHTNAEGIVSTFKQAALYQKGKNLESFVSVVVLDEIGLAEDSPKMPLKTLHPLLEEGYVENGKRTEFGKVGFVGISNWALDPAKMNRGILVSRTVPKSAELIKSANGICRITKEGKPLEKLIQPLSDAYEEIYDAQIRAGDPEYFGLRDFYGLLKMLHREFIRNGRKPLNWSTVQSAIRRNFGEKDDKALQIFVKRLKMNNVYQTCRVSSNKADTMSLVEENMKEAEKRAELSEEQRNMDNESRYLLLMTENFSALQLLPQVLNLKDCEIIFGSSFPQDQEYIQVCKNINRIKVCMEMGTTVVLLNLGSLYESLYDALNQYYVYYGGKRFVDLGLGSNRVKCSVSEKFRLIMIEEEQVALKFPIPLLNRLEKHFLGMESILSPSLKEIREKVCESVEKFSSVPRQDCNDDFSIRDAFVGYQEDTTACVVMQAKNFVDAELGEIDIFKVSMDNIFQTCTKEAIMRVIPEKTEIDEHHVWSLYKQQGRRNLSQFLYKQFYSKNVKNAHHLVEVTTFCRIPSHNDIKSINREQIEVEGTPVSDDRHCVINLNVFETEHEFVERVKDFVRRSRKHKLKKILFVTCSKGNRFVSLIACVKYSLQNLLLEFKDPNLFIVFLVQLPRNWYKSNYSSFSVGKWTSFHIDKLIVEEEIESMMEVTECQGSTLRDLFVLKSGECSKFQRRLLRDVVYEAVADSRSPGSDKVLKVSNVFRLFEEHHDPSLEVIFLNKAAIFIDNECGHDKELKKWMAEKASNLHELIQNGDAEHALFYELKQKVKPHLAEFLETIDFNNNVRLLFENSWCKNLWIELFSLKEISQARILNKQRNAFDSVFPFSAEIIAKMDKMWNEAQENCDDQDMEADEFFIYCFENQEDDSVWKILRQVSLEDSVLDAFIHDLIYHEFLGTISNIKSEQNKFIRKSVMLRMPALTETKSLAVAFTVFVSMKPEIAAIAPALRLVPCKKPAPIDVSFKKYVLRTAVDNISKDANDISPDKSDISKFVQDVQIVKMSSASLPDDPAFNLQLQKLSLLSTFLEEVCHGLDEELTQQAASGAKTIWTSIRNEQNLSGSKKLVSRLTFCLKKSLDAVLKVCLRREFGRPDCAVCRKDVTGKGIVPFVIPCERKHVAHQKCWQDKMKAFKNNQEGNLARDEEIKCLLCNEQINRDVLDHYVAKVHSCNEENTNALWNQFSENICKVFINLVKDHFTLNCEKEAANEIIKNCLFYNENSQKEASPHYITHQSKQALVTIFAQSNPELLNQVLEELIRDDLTTDASQINCSKTLDMLLAVFDCIISNDGLPHTPQKPPKFVEKLQRLVEVKTTLRKFCNDLIGEMNRSRRIDPIIPKPVRDVLERRKKEIRDHLKNFFIRTVCLDHGMNYYAQVKEIPAIQALIPQILLNSQVGDFVDIFLVIPNYQNTMTEFVQGLTDNHQNAIAILERKEPLVKNLVVYRYLLDISRIENNREVFQTVLAALKNRSFNCLGNILDRNDRLSPNHTTQNLEEHFFFLLQVVFLIGRPVGILDPLRSIALNETNENQLFLPTFPDSVQRNLRIVDNVVRDFTTWNTCPNGHQYLIGDCGQPNAPGVCPDCRAPIGGGQHRFNPNNQRLGNRGAVPANNTGQARGYNEGASNSRNFERQVNSLTGNVMRAFLHATLYLKSGNIAMANKLKQNADTIGRSALNISQDNVWKFLVHVLITATNQQLQGSFQSEDTREQWENAFSAHTINAQRNLNAVLETYDAAFRQDCRNEFNSLPTVLYGKPTTELPNPQSFEDDLMCFEKFWARTPKVALETFAAQINADKDRYPLLSALLDENVVEALQLIPTFLHMFKEIMKHYNADESHNIHTIKDFLDDLPVGVTENVSDGVRRYIRTWNTLIRHRLDTYPTIKCLFKDRLTMDAPLKFFLPTRHVSDCAVLVTMNFLISKNNELIEKYRRACKIETPVLYLEEGNGEDNVVWVSDLKKDLLSVVVTFTTQDFTNNTPTVIHDFAAIERAVGSSLCAFKPLIKMKIMPLMSKSSSTKSALNNARPNLEEKPLGKNEAGRLKKAFTDMPEVCKALRQLVLLMKYLDKDCSRESSTIAEYMKNKLKLECVPAIGNYELNQTVSLWQHLSVRKTYLMIEHVGENPYPEILDDFKEELDFDKKEHLSKMKREQKEKLLIMLNEFIVLNLHEPELMKPDYHIEADCLNIYFVEETELGLPEWAELRYAEDIIKLLIETDV